MASDRILVVKSRKEPSSPVSKNYFMISLIIVESLLDVGFVTCNLTKSFFTSYKKRKINITVGFTVLIIYTIYFILIQKNLAKVRRPELA